MIVTRLPACMRGPASQWCEGPHNCVDPVPMQLRCPVCNGQHIDASDPAIQWTNPPHKCVLCNFCGHLWRPFAYPTEGVA